MTKATKAIYFDMDGTIADLYGVENWEPMLRGENVRPYAIAKPLVDMNRLNDILARFHNKGVRVGVISWGSMGGTEKYLRETEVAKREWLRKHIEVCDEIHVVEYGTPKHSVCEVKGSILVDDNAEVRGAWPWKTIDARDGEAMLKELEDILEAVPA